MKDILFISACVRAQSRTRKLAEYLLDKLKSQNSSTGCIVTEVDLAKEKIKLLDNARMEKRMSLVKEYKDRKDAGDDCSKVLSDDLMKYADRFRKADVAVIAAPYWDLSFPAIFKGYMESLMVTSLTFDYTPEGFPYGMCNAKELYFVTTAGGPVISDEYGFGYVKAIAKNFFNIEKVEYIKAEGLDIEGADVEKILSKARADIDKLF